MVSYRCVFCKRFLVERGLEQYVAWVVCDQCLRNVRIIIDGKIRTLEKISEEERRKTKAQEIIAAHAALKD